MSSSNKPLGPFDADPNLIPFREEWKDNTGSIANAIFWLDANWKKELNAQGDFVDKHGRRWFWNYGWLTNTLMVHISGSRECWRIDREKMLHMKDGVEENATIYRPFFASRSYGVALYHGKQPQVEWLVTREVKVVKSHHPDRFPLYVGTAVDNAIKLLQNSPFAQFPHVQLHRLLEKPTAEQRKEFMPEALVVIYCDLLNQCRTLKSIDTPFEEFHIHSYNTLVNITRAFNQTLVEEAESAAHAKILMGLFDEMTRLVQLREAHDAALVDALHFNRPVADSLEKTKHMVDALYPETNHD